MKNVFELLHCILKNNYKQDFKYSKVTEIDVNEIIKLKHFYGIGGVILDVDGTLRDTMDDLSSEVVEWLKMLKCELKVCIVSNGVDGKIDRLVHEIGIEYIPLAWKPFRRSFQKAANLMGLDFENILIIGNSLISDLYGGMCCGMKTIVICKKEF